jgi:hypothetical protein
VDEALAYQEELDAACPGCGHPTDEAWSTDHMDSYVPKLMRCFACEAAARAGRSATGEDRDSLFVITRFDPRPI